MESESKTKIAIFPTFKFSEMGYAARLHPNGYVYFEKNSDQGNATNESCDTTPTDSTSGIKHEDEEESVNNLCSTESASTNEIDVTQMPDDNLFVDIEDPPSPYAQQKISYETNEPEHIEENPFQETWNEEHEENNPVPRVSGQRRRMSAHFIKRWKDDLATSKQARCLLSHCNFISLDLQEMMDHYRSCDGEPSFDKGVLCTRCGYWLRSNAMRNVHMRTCNKVKFGASIMPSASSENDTSVTYAKPGKKRAAEPTEEGPISCPFCDKKIRNKTYWKVHVSTCGCTDGLLDNNTLAMLWRYVSDKEPDEIIQKIHQSSTNSVLRRRSYNDVHLRNWHLKMDCERFIPCHFQNCRFIAMSVKDMILHYGRCSGDSSFAPFECRYCNGRLTTQEILRKHVERSHQDDEATCDYIDNECEGEKYAKPLGSHQMPVKSSALTYSTDFKKVDYLDGGDDYQNDTSPKSNPFKIVKCKNLIPTTSIGVKVEHIDVRKAFFSQRDAALKQLQQIDRARMIQIKEEKKNLVIVPKAVIPRVNATINADRLSVGNAREKHVELPAILRTRKNMMKIVSPEKKSPAVPVPPLQYSAGRSIQRAKETAVSLAKEMKIASQSLTIKKAGLITLPQPAKDHQIMDNGLDHTEEFFGLGREEEITIKEEVDLENLLHFEKECNRREKHGENNADLQCTKEIVYSSSSDSYGDHDYGSRIRISNSKDILAIREDVEQRLRTHNIDTFSVGLEKVSPLTIVRPCVEFAYRTTTNNTLVMPCEIKCTSTVVEAGSVTVRNETNEPSHTPQSSSERRIEEYRHADDETCEKVPQVSVESKDENFCYKNPEAAVAGNLEKKSVEKPKVTAIGKISFLRKPNLSIRRKRENAGGKSEQKPSEIDDNSDRFEPQKESTELPHPNSSSVVAKDMTSNSPNSRLNTEDTAMCPNLTPKGSQPPIFERSSVIVCTTPKGYTSNTSVHGTDIIRANSDTTKSEDFAKRNEEVSAVESTFKEEDSSCTLNQVSEIEQDESFTVSVAYDSEETKLSDETDIISRTHNSRKNSISKIEGIRTKASFKESVQEAEKLVESESIVQTDNVPVQVIITNRGEKELVKDARTTEIVELAINVPGMQAKTNPVQVITIKGKNVGENSEIVAETVEQAIDVDVSNIGQAIISPVQVIITNRKEKESNGSSEPAEIVKQTIEVPTIVETNTSPPPVVPTNRKDKVVVKHTRPARTVKPTRKSLKKVLIVNREESIIEAERVVTTENSEQTEKIAVGVVITNRDECINENDSIITPTGEQTDSSVPLPVKRKRGRPRKNPAAEEISTPKQPPTETNKDEQVTPAPRKRGPQKINLVEEECIGPRKRAPPKKYVISDDESENDTSRNASEYEHDTESDEARKPRKRSRSKKSASIIPLVKGKRGRPAKLGSDDDDDEPLAKKICRRSESGCDNKKTDTPKAKKDNVETRLSGSRVTCAKCDQSLTERKFARHNYEQHNGLSWKKGEDPVDLNDGELVLSLLREAHRVTRAFKCELCKEVKRSVFGFETHLRTCGKTPAELEEYFVKCVECGRSMAPYSMPMHLRVTHQYGTKKRVEPETPSVAETEKEDEVPVELSGKRKSALRAATKLKAVINEEKENFLFHKVGTTATIIPVSLERLFAMSSKNPLKCIRSSECEFVSKTLPIARKHFYNCPTLPKSYFQCLDCKEFFLEKSAVKEHAANHPQTDKVDDYNAATESDSDDDDEDEGDVETEEEVGNIEEEEEEEGKDYGYQESLKKSGQNEEYERITPEARLRRAFLSRHGALGNQHKLYWRAFEEEFISRLNETTTDPRFPTLHTSLEDWIHLDEPEYKAYLPPTQKSLNVSWREGKRRGDPVQIDAFSSAQINDCTTMFVGGPVRTMAWCPLRFTSSPSPEFLAVVVSSQAEDLPDISTDELVATMLQIWTFPDLGSLAETNSSSRLSMGLAFDYGELWDIAWAPDCESGERGMAEGDHLPRIGVIACAFQDGKARIYSIADPDRCSSSCDDSRLPIYKLSPRVTLIHSSSSSAFTPACTKLCWGPNNCIYVGYGDGIVDIFSLNNLPAGQKNLTLRPVRSFKPQKNVINALSVCPTNSNLVFTGGPNRSIQLWNMSPSYPQLQSSHATLFQTPIQWTRHWPAFVFIASENCAVFHYLYEQDIESKQYLHGEALARDISFSDWLFTLALGNSAGEVLLRTSRDPHIAYSIKTPKELIHIISSATVNSKSGKKEFSSYADAEQNDCEITFVDYDQISTTAKKFKFANDPSLSNYDLTAVCKMAFNPHFNNLDKLAVGYGCGLIRILSIKMHEGEWKLLKSKMLEKYNVKS